MRKYLPNLLPNQPEFNIDGEEIFENKNNKKRRNTALQTFLYILAIIILISSLALIFTRFWQGLLLLVLGLLILPNGHRWIERKLRFKFTILPKTIFCVILMIFAIIIGDNYEKKEKEIAKNERIEKEKEQLAKAKAEQAEKARIDSLSMFQNIAIQQINENKLKDAYNSIQITLRLSNAENERNKSNSINADYLLKSNKYPDAITVFTALIGRNYNLSVIYYKRAICYQKTKKVQEAVNDLREAIKLGNDEANQLHEILNPMKKKLVGYTTLCCDGTTSSKRGRGACSRHGGVCNWNHPVYEEYRQY